MVDLTNTKKNESKNAHNIKRNDKRLMGRVVARELLHQELASVSGGIITSGGCTQIEPGVYRCGPTYCLVLSGFVHGFICVMDD